MADLTDVETKLVEIIAGAIYPNGGGGAAGTIPGSPVVAIGRGWPLPDSLDAMLAANNCAVTVFPLSGSATPTYQLLNKTHVITPAAITSTFTLEDTVITVAGQISAGEFLTLIIDDAVVCSQTGANVAAMLAALAAEAVAAGYAATATATTLTVPFKISMTVRQGGVGVLGRVIHRQRASIVVTVWAPNDTIRTAAAILADVAIKQNIKVTMPDKSQCILRYLRTMSSDQMEKANLYRRDLVYDAEYATIEQFPGTTITSTKVSIAQMDSTAIATVIE